MGAEKEYVKKVFKQYREKELYLRENELPRINANFQLAMPTFGHRKHSAVEELAVKRADALEYNEAVIRCINRLETLERRIVVESFVCRSNRTGNWEIWERLYISRAMFYAAKRTAIEKLSVLFRLENLC